MPNCNQAVFKKSLLAAAVLSLSACSTTPRMQDYDLSRIGEGILNAGKSTADLSRRTWDKTTYLLGFSDGDPSSNEDQLQQPLDEVDLAMMEEDAVWPGGLSTSPLTQSEPTDLVKNQFQEVPDSMPGEGLRVPSESELSAANAQQIEDLIYEVAVNENLWHIAKLTTGDATNWHVLADVNNLAPNAAVFPGQHLVIPANLIRRDVASTDTNNDEYMPVASATLLDTQQSELAMVETLDSQAPADSDNALVTETPAARLPIPTAEDPANTPQVAGTPFKVQPSETLWDLAKRSTGDALNWQVIAERNNFSGKQAVVVRPGQTIYVPDELVKADDVQVTDVSANQDTVAEEESPKLAENTTTTQIVAGAADGQQGETATDPVIVSVESEHNKPLEKSDSFLLDETQPLAIPETTNAAALNPQTEQSETAAAAATPMQLPGDESPATAVAEATGEKLMLAEATVINKASALANTVDPSTSAVDATAIDSNTQTIKIVDPAHRTNNDLKIPEAADSAVINVETGTQSTEQGRVPAEIMVSGTYYPKAVYNEADFSSSLLMRVSPGTKLQVSNAIGTWFQVETDKGVGYVHQRDIK